MPAILRYLSRAFLVMTFVAGCSSSSSGGSGGFCSQKGKCPNEPPPSSSGIQSCEKNISDAKCGTVNEALYRCAFDKEVCTAAGGFDTTGTLAKCSKEYDAVKTCAGAPATGAMVMAQNATSIDGLIDALGAR